MKKKLALILPALLILGLEYFLCWNDLKPFRLFLWLNAGTEL